MSKILIVVDMQNDFIDGALGTKEAVAIFHPSRRSPDTRMPWRKPRVLPMHALIFPRI